MPLQKIETKKAKEIGLYNIKEALWYECFNELIR